MTQTALILGASGRFGRHAARNFARAGWQLRTFDRASDDLNQAAQGVDVIVNGWNPPYPKWPRLVPRLHAQVIAAARSSGATVLIPGNVYVFGARTSAPWSETARQGAMNELGRIRIDMEQAYRRSGVRTILLRAGDFLDTGPSGNWFDAVLVKSLRRGLFTYPGNPDIPHAWAYLPDLARAAVDLAERRMDLPVYCDVPFPGYTLSGTQMAELLNRVLARQIRLKQMSWLPVHLAAPVWPVGRRLLEMRYLWNTPHWLGSERFDDLLPDFVHTDAARALARCIPGDLVDPQVQPDQPVPTGA